MSANEVNTSQAVYDAVSAHMRKFGANGIAVVLDALRDEVEGLDYDLYEDVSDLYDRVVGDDEEDE